jgi:glutamate 5-kinase
MPPSASAPQSARPRRVVVKLGTGVITTGIGVLDTKRIEALCAQLAALRAGGTEVIVVSSGAVGLGMGRLGLARKPKEVTKKQACAAIGQSLLMQTWQQGFAPHGINVAQVLLTREDMQARSRYLSIKAVLAQLVSYGTIPIINENDTVSAAEINAMLKFGDNDTLSAMVAGLVEAQYLVILSTAPGLIDMKGSGEILPVVEKITPQIEAMAGGTTSETATGGMISKISAAKLALKAGCGVFIASGSEPDVLPRLFAGHGPGTFFVPDGLKLESRKRWLAYYQRPSGTLEITAPAVAALRGQGRSLLAVGVTRVKGLFEAGETVTIVDPDGTVIARGKTPFSSAELLRVAGLKGEEVARIHPGRKRLEVVHRDDLVLL